MTVQGGIARGTAALLTQLGRWRSELRDNRRATVGALVIWGLVVVYGLTVLDDAVDALRARAADANHRLNIFLTSAQEKEWPERAASSAKLRQSLEARLWKSENEGMAKADIQDWVSGQAREAGLQRVQISLDSSKLTNLPVQLQQITATLTALYTESSLLSFLDRVSRDPRFLVVDHLSVREKPIASMELKLTAFTMLNDGRSEAK